MKFTTHNNMSYNRFTTKLADGQPYFAALMGGSALSVGLLLALSAPGVAAPSLSAHLSPADFPTLDRPLETTKAYRPPADTRPPRGPFIPGARRTGCSGVAHHGLTAIAPHQQVGRTFSTQPTLTWFVASATPYPLTLELYEYSNDAWIKQSDVDLGTSQPGYGHYTVPDSAALRVGGLYRWNIVMTCDRARPSRNRVDTAQFEVVSPPAGLVSSANSQLTQAQQNAAAGFWYDAIALVTASEPIFSEPISSEPISSEPISSEPAAVVSPDLLDYRKTLLLTLSESESPEFGEQLQFIINADNNADNGL